MVSLKPSAIWRLLVWAVVLWPAGPKGPPIGRSIVAVRPTGLQAVLVCILVWLASIESRRGAFASPLYGRLLSLDEVDYYPV